MLRKKHKADSVAVIGKNFWLDAIDFNAQNLPFCPSVDESMLSSHPEHHRRAAVNVQLQAVRTESVQNYTELEAACSRKKPRCSNG